MMQTKLNMEYIDRILKLGRCVNIIIAVLFVIHMMCTMILMIKIWGKSTNS